MNIDREQIENRKTILQNDINILSSAVERELLKMSHKISEDDSVSVKSKTGIMNHILVRPFDIKKGAVLMYYPEVNSLISQSVDPLSRTPGFKSTTVIIQAGQS